MILQRGFAILDIVFGHGNLTYNPSSIQKLSLLIQFSVITTLQSLVLEQNGRGVDQSWSCL